MSDMPLIDRARALAGRSALVVLPLAAVAPAAEAATLLHDYSFAGEYSSSGWFMSWQDDAAAAATPQGSGLTLTGAKTIDDGLFWRWDDNYQLTLRRYDVTGIAFAWGGAIDGSLRDGDLIRTPFDFMIDFTHTTPQFAAFDYTNVNWGLRFGLRSDPYSPESWQSIPTSNSLVSTESYGSLSEPGTFGFQGTLNLPVGDWAASQATQWTAVLTIDWSDALASQGWEDTHGSRNGDTLTATVNSLAPSIVPTWNTQAGETVTNDGAFTAPTWSVLRTAGTFRNLAGGIFENPGTSEIAAGGLFQNAGTIRNLLGGAFGNAGRVDNLAGASFENAGQLQGLFGGAFHNAGTVDNQTEGSIDNAGTIRNLVGGLFGNAGRVDNQSDGVIENAGTLRNLLGGAFGNAGRVDNLAGATFENAGQFQGLSGGAFGNAGRVDNLAGGTFDNQGSFGNLLGGVFGNAGTLDNSGSFDNVGTLNNLFGGVVMNRGSFTNSSAHTVNNDGLFVVEGVLTNTSTGMFRNAGRLEIAEWGTLENDGVLDNSGTIVNAGIVLIGTTGTVTGVGDYTQSAGSTRVDGLLAAREVRFEGGVLDGVGRVVGTESLVFGDGVTITPGGDDAIGSLILEGGFAPAATGALFIDIDGARHDALSIVGDVVLGGDLFLDIASAPAPGASVTFLTFTGGTLTGTFAHIHAGGRDVTAVYGIDHVAVMFSAPVPEPGTYALFLAGLGLLGLARRR